MLKSLVEISNVSRHDGIKCFVVTQFRVKSRFAVTPASSISYLEDESDDTFYRITTPQRMDENIRRRLVHRQLQEAEMERRRRLGTPIIACCRPAYNLYKGRQMFTKDSSLTSLASHGWKHSRSKGDFFTVNAFSDRSFYFASDSGSNIETRSFTSLPISASVVNRLSQVLGLKQPTSVQEMAIPQILSGRSLQMAAENGSGKTLAYLLPLMEQSYRENWENQLVNSVQAVILAPSRELARQIENVSRKLGFEGMSNPLLRPGLLLDQSSLSPKGDANFNVAISTPFHFLNQLNNGLHREALASVRRVVIDEADTLLDDSFSQAIKAIFNHLRNFSRTENGQSQVVLASAILPSALHEVIGEFVGEEELLAIKTKRLHRLASHISHKFVRCGPSEKSDLIVKLARRAVLRKSPTIIFCNRAVAVNFLVKLLLENDIPAEHVAALHGRLTLEERDSEWMNFFVAPSNKRFAKTILISTDLASRGLDSTHIRQVVNFDMPKTVSDYIHRSGRLGRVAPASMPSSSGCLVTSFVTYHSDVELTWQLELAARQAAIGNSEPMTNVDANIKRQLTEASSQRLLRRSSHAPCHLEVNDNTAASFYRNTPFPSKFLGQE